MSLFNNCYSDENTNNHVHNIIIIIIIIIIMIIIIIIITVEHRLSELIGDWPVRKIKLYV